MHDPRKPRPLKPRSISLLVLDSNNFSRSLITDITINLGVDDVVNVNSAELAYEHLLHKPCDGILLSWDQGDALDGLHFVRELRRVPNQRLRRLPVIFITSGLTREFVIAARDAGVDEFLSKPISPAAVRQRLEMVIETPRPFVDCEVFIGPCRRRKNPADYHGAKRRAGDRSQQPDTPQIDYEEQAAAAPIRVALAALRAASMGMTPQDAASRDAANAALREAQLLASKAQDNTLVNALATYQAYIDGAARKGRMEAPVISAALGALEQLATLPIDFAEARTNVAQALGKAIQKKLAA